MENNIKFIFFDIGGVFLEWDNCFKNAAKKHNLDRQQISALFGKYDDQITKGQMTPEEFWRKCQEELFIKNAKDFNFLESWVDDYIPITDVYSFVKALSKKYKIGLISNIYKGMFSLLIEKNIIPNISFDVKILSCEVGLRKPEIEIYTLAQSKCHLKNSEILFIDDVKIHLEPAKRMGWQTFLFETHNVDKSIAGIQSLLDKRIIY